MILLHNPLLISPTLAKKGPTMVTIDQASSSERGEIGKLIAEYHASEGIAPIEERITWAVNQQLSSESPGILLVAREKGTIVGEALAVYTPSAELGRVITVNDFFVRPDPGGTEYEENWRSGWWRSASR